MIKNNRNTALKYVLNTLDEATNRIVRAAITNGLTVGTTYRFGEEGPEMVYSISLGKSHLFHGSVNGLTSPSSLDKTIAAITGAITSVVSPPMDRSVYYWRRERMMGSEIGIDGDPVRVEPWVTYYWVGYSRRNEAIARVPDGEKNPHFNEVERVDKITLAPGNCVFAIVPYVVAEGLTEHSMGEEIKLAEIARLEKIAEQAAEAEAEALRIQNENDASNTETACSSPTFVLSVPSEPMTASSLMPAMDRITDPHKQTP